MANQFKDRCRGRGCDLPRELHTVELHTFKSHSYLCTKFMRQGIIYGNAPELLRTYTRQYRLEGSETLKKNPEMLIWRLHESTMIKD